MHNLSGIAASLSFACDYEMHDFHYGYCCNKLSDLPYSDYSSSANVVCGRARLSPSSICYIEALIEET